MILKNEVLLKNKNNWLHFKNPHLIICAKKIEDVRGALQEVEMLVNKNHWHAAGFVSYDAAPAFDSALHVIPSDEFPLLWFGLYPAPDKIPEIPSRAEDLGKLDWTPSVDRETYNAAIQQVKENIAQGKTYQVNYTMRLHAQYTSEAWNLFIHLAQSQNKYAAYISTDQFALCSASPELFFTLEENLITSKPMKGTVKRGRNTAEDQEKIAWLKSSIKNRAENVMIVDMIRNDIGRIAETGSVHVPELFSIEKYTTLFQMTSTVRGKTNASIAEIFDALFPCASITGAPKVSTMNIIAALETTPRKIYTGSIGFIAPNRQAQFNVAIRTAVIDHKQKTVEYGVGGGIVWDSTSADEYLEALLKARILTKSPQEFSLIETLLWTPKEGYFLREKHLARLKDSANYFDFTFSDDLFKSYLEEIVQHLHSPQRIRVTLNRSGGMTHQCTAAPQSGAAFTARLADKAIDSSDMFFFHKTSQRNIYPKPERCDDVLLYNENDELTEFTIGNLVIETNGCFFTPPVSCGLLAGTFREQLIEEGKVAERIIHKNEIKTCERVFLINSVRKWVEVKMLDEK